MNNFEEIEQEIFDSGITLDFVDFKSERIKGLCCGNSIAISKNLNTSAEKICVAAEEIGHHETSVGNILDMNDVQNRKQERKARLWAYNKQIGLISLVEAYKHGCHGQNEVAEYLNVTEEFLKEAIDCYRSKYGICAEVDNYVVFFEPALAVMEKYN